MVGFGVGSDFVVTAGYSSSPQFSDCCILNVEKLKGELVTVLKAVQQS